MTININRLFLNSKDDKVILKAYLGYGIAGYTSKYYYKSPTPNTSQYGTASSFPVFALAVEYYLTKLFSVGAKAQFRPFNVNTLEGDPRYNLDNVTNDNIVAATIYLRLKLVDAN